MRLPLLVAFAALLSAGVAHASSVMLDASGTFQSGATLSGTVLLDQTAGTFISVDLTVSAPDSLTFTTIDQQMTDYPATGDYYLAAGPVSGDFLVLGINQSSLIGYDGGPLASLSDLEAGGFYSIVGAGGSEDALKSGSLTALVAPTPEPSSIILLGTGLLGAVGVVRRRLVS